MGRILLEGMEFYAYHGLYAAEHQIGNRFTVDVELELETEAAGRADDVSLTLDYAEVYQLTAELMQHRKKSLEAVSYSIAAAIRERWQHIDVVKVRVSKHTPPFGGLTRLAMVEQVLRR